MSEEMREKPTSKASSNKKRSGKEQSAGQKLKKAGRILKRRIEKGYHKYRVKQIRKKKNHIQLKKKLSMKEYIEYRIYEIISGEWKQIVGFLLAFLVLLLLLTACVKGIGHLVRNIHLPQFQPQTEMETETETETEPVFPVTDITVGSTGCMLLHSPFIDRYAEYSEEVYDYVYDYSSVYKFITPYYSKPDFMTCEFEGALGGPDVGYSGHPLFVSPDIIIENIRDSGIDLQFLATNHIYDAGNEGFHRTMDVYEEKKIPYTGIRKDTGKDPFYIADIKGVKVGFIDYVYQTEDGTTGKSVNGIPLVSGDYDLLNSFSYLNLDKFYTDLEKNIKSMKKKGAQYIIAQIHWGTEYMLEPDSDQLKMAQRMCNLGVDALIGGHPHCEEPIDVITSDDGSNRRMFIVYSEGNALSNQRKELMDEMPSGHTEDGCMITLTLHQDSHGDVTLTNIELLPTWVYRFFNEDGNTRYYILPLDDVENIEDKTGIKGIYEQAGQSYDRTMEEMGPGLEKALKTFYHAPEPETEPQTETETE